MEISSPFQKSLKKWKIDTNNSAKGLTFELYNFFYKIMFRIDVKWPEIVFTKNENRFRIE